MPFHLPVCFSEESRPDPPRVTLIYNYLSREILFLSLTIVGVLTFLMVGVELFKVIGLILYTDLPIWLVLKYVILLIPFVLTLTLPAGLLGGVVIVFGRMSSDRELLALKASGIGLAPVVAPVIFMAVAFSLVNYWIIAYINPKCREETNGMRHEMVTNNPMSLFNPESVIDKVPGFKIYFDKKIGNELTDVHVWRLDELNQLVSSISADRARVDLDLEHQQLVLTLFNEGGETLQVPGDFGKVQPGAAAAQLPMAVSLSTFYDKVQKKLAWMTLPEIQDVIYSMETGSTGEPATPYLTELQARVSFSISCFTFVLIGLPLAIQTQRRETAVGIIITIGIVGAYYLLGTIGRSLKAQASFYPELIIWAPNIIFQSVGAYLFYLANRK